MTVIGKRIAYQAQCDECGWGGPYRAISYGAIPDRDKHDRECPKKSHPSGYGTPVRHAGPRSECGICPPFPV